MEKNPQNDLVYPGERVDDLQNGLYVIQNPENHAHNMLGNEMMRECEEIKRQLPISSYSRPAWDLETLGAMSLKEFHVDLGISSRIYLEKDEFYNPTPLFMLRTVK